MPAAVRIKLSDQLGKVPTRVRPIVRAAIATVKEVAPKAEEIAYRSEPPRSKSAMWKLVRYAAGGGYVVGVGTFTSHSGMVFYRGLELDDGSGPLPGSGKDSRLIQLCSP